MQQIKILESPGFDQLILDIEECVKQFSENGVIVYRNANFSKEQQIILMTKLGDLLGWDPNSRSEVPGFYQENHARKGLSKEDRKNKDEILIHWHMEHTDFLNPIIGASWNMHLFTCDTSIGRTGFVDTTVLYESMPKDWQDFLLNCIEVTNKEIILEGTKAISNNEIECIKKHWISGKPTIRIDLDTRNVVGIKKINKDEVTEDDLDLFKTIKEFVFNHIYHNDNIKLVHEWQQGDIVIADLFRMAHAVYGGFYPEERDFTGVWAYKDSLKV